MASQLGYLWNVQRTAPKPFRSLLFTHLDQRLGDNLEASVWSKANGRWLTTEWWDGKELDGLWKGERGRSPKPCPQPENPSADVDSSDVSSHPPPPSLDGASKSRARRPPLGLRRPTRSLPPSSPTAAPLYPPVSLRRPSPRSASCPRGRARPTSSI